MIGVFAALDSLLFYVLWAAEVSTMIIIICVWSGPLPFDASCKFSLYTFLGSVLMLVALIYMYLKTCDAGKCSYEIASFQQLPLSLNVQVLIFFAFLAAFAV